MPRIYEADEVIIAKIMRDHLNSWPKKPAVFMLEDIDKDAPSLMIQQLASARFLCWCLEFRCIYES